MATKRDDDVVVFLRSGAVLRVSADALRTVWSSESLGDPKETGAWIQSKDIEAVVTASALVETTRYSAASGVRGPVSGKGSPT